MSSLYDGNRGTSWFSMKDPYRLRSTASLLSVLMPLTRLLILPLVDSNAWRIQK